MYLDMTDRSKNWTRTIISFIIVHFFLVIFITDFTCCDVFHLFIGFRHAWSFNFRICILSWLSFQWRFEFLKSFVRVFLLFLQHLYDLLTEETFIICVRKIISNFSYRLKFWCLLRLGHGRTRENLLFSTFHQVLEFIYVFLRPVGHVDDACNQQYHGHVIAYQIGQAQLVWLCLRLFWTWSVLARLDAVRTRSFLKVVIYLEKNPVLSRLRRARQEWQGKVSLQGRPLCSFICL